MLVLVRQVMLLKTLSPVSFWVNAVNNRKTQIQQFVVIYLENVTNSCDSYLT